MSHDEATTELSSFPLKPCPFCGHEAFSECKTDKHNYSRTGEVWHVECTECGAKAGILSECESEACFQWNWRDRGEFNFSTALEEWQAQPQPEAEADKEGEK